MQRTTPKAFPKAVETMNQGVSWYDRGCYERAITFFWDAHEQFSSMDMPQGVAASLNSIANADRQLGDLDNALLFFKQSLNIYEQLQNAERQVKVLADMAAAYTTSDNITLANEYLDKAEYLAQKSNVKNYTLSIVKGICLTREKEYGQARALLQNTASMIEPEDLNAKATLHAALGHLELAAGNFDEARKYFRFALDADRLSGFYHGIADNLEQLARIDALKGKKQESLFYFERSIKVYALLGLENKVELLAAQMEPLAISINQDIRLTLNLARRWAKGEVQHHLCN